MGVFINSYRWAERTSYNIHTCNFQIESGQKLIRCKWKCVCLMLALGKRSKGQKVSAKPKTCFLKWPHSSYKTRNMKTTTNIFNKIITINWPQHQFNVIHLLIKLSNVKYFVVLFMFLVLFIHVPFTIRTFSKNTFFWFSTDPLTFEHIST